MVDKFLNGLISFIGKFNVLEMTLLLVGNLEERILNFNSQSSIFSHEKSCSPPPSTPKKTLQFEHFLSTAHATLSCHRKPNKSQPYMKLHNASTSKVTKANNGSGRC